MYDPIDHFIYFLGLVLLTALLVGPWVFGAFYLMGWL